MTMKTAFVVVGAGIVTTVLGLGFTRMNFDGKVLDRNGVRLAIPEQFLTKERLPPWIRWAPGLDSDEGSALITIPTAQMKEFLPETSPEPVGFSTLIQILEADEIERAVRLRAEHVDRINSHRDEYSASEVVADPGTGFYRLYDKYNRDTASTTIKWEVIRRPPPLGSDDLIATCMRHEMSVITTCELPTFVVDGIAVQMGIREEHLPYYERFKQHIAELLRSWRVESKTAIAT